MHVLVTGASGFLGSHIVDSCLARGDRVRVLVRRSSDLSYLRTLPGVELTFGDMTERDSVLHATRGIDTVIHSAARVTDHGSRAQFWSENVTATELLLEASKSNGARRFVFVSSPSVVMDGSDQVDIDESHPYPRRYLNLYSETKAAAERAVLRANEERLVTCSIRPRAVWGPRDKSGYMPKILKKMMAAKMADLSAGRKVMASLCYCTNAAEACVLAARARGVGGKAYFVTDAEKTDVWAFARRIAELFGVPPISRTVSPVIVEALVHVIELLWKLPILSHRYSPPVSRYSLALLTRTGTYDTRAAARDLGYRPTVDQETGLAQLKAWVDDIGGVGEFVRHVK